MGIEAIATGNLSLLASPIVANIDSSVAQIWLPTTACQRFEEVFGLTWNEESNLYLVNETLHKTLLIRNDNITFTLSNEKSQPISTIDIVLPYASFDLTASYPLVAYTSTHYFPLRRAENESQYVLTRTFLQEAYLLVDYERSLFSISQARFPDPWDDPSIEPIYRPFNMVSFSEGSGYDVYTSAALVVRIVRLWPVVFISCVVYRLWSKSIFTWLPRKPIHLFEGQRFGISHGDFFGLLHMIQLPPPAEEDVADDSCTMYNKKGSYATQQPFRQEPQFLDAGLLKSVRSGLVRDSVDREVSAFLSELEGVLAPLISILSEDRPSTIDQLRVYVEKLTGTEWDWWPLLPYEKLLLPGFSRIRWPCVRSSGSLSVFRTSLYLIGIRRRVIEGCIDYDCRQTC